MDSEAGRCLSNGEICNHVLYYIGDLMMIAWYGYATCVSSVACQEIYTPPPVLGAQSGTRASRLQQKTLNGA